MRSIPGCVLVLDPRAVARHFTDLFDGVEHRGEPYTHRSSAARRALGPTRLRRLAAFEALTGTVAPTLVDWITGREMDCDDRPTPLSRSVPDRAGARCDATDESTPPTAGQPEPDSDSRHSLRR